MVLTGEEEARGVAQGKSLSHWHGHLHDPSQSKRPPIFGWPLFLLVSRWLLHGEWYVYGAGCVARSCCNRNGVAAGCGCRAGAGPRG